MSSCAGLALGALGASVGVNRAPLSQLASRRRGGHRQHHRRGRVAAARITATNNGGVGVSGTSTSGDSDQRRGSGAAAARWGGEMRRGGTWCAPMVAGVSTRGALRCRGFFDNFKNPFGGGGKSEDDDDDDMKKMKNGDAAGSEAGSSAAVAPAAASSIVVEKEEKEKDAPRAPEYTMPKQDFKATMSALDALLPPDEAEVKRRAQDAADEARAAQLSEEKGKKKTSASETPEGAADISVSISPAALKALKDAERARKDGGGGAPPGVDSFDGKNISKSKTGVEKRGGAGAGVSSESDGDGNKKDAWLNQVVDGMSDAASRDRDERTEEENAKLDKVLADLSDLAKKDKDERTSEEIKAKFDSLFEILEISDEPAVPKEDVQRLKDEVFGYNTFWVTGTEELGPEIMGEGVLIKGNLRANRAEVWVKVQEGVERLFEGKYTPFMLEEPGSMFGDDDVSPSTSTSTSGSFDSSDPRGANSRGPRVSFLIVPSDKAGPNPQTSAWQYFVAVALFALTAGSALQLGLVAEVSRLPQATMDWLAAGSQGLDNTLAPGELPPGLEGFDSAAYVEGAFPILGGIFAASAAHEIGHIIAGAATNIKLSIPFLIPNGQLGSFGTVTQIKSLPKTRQDLFDVSFAGPLAGSLVAGSLFAYGLVLSAGGGGGGGGEELLPIPPELFQGSLLLGAISELVLGDLGDTAKGVLVHPLFIAGWCGLVTQALNCLPVGQIDGGRITQTAFGRSALGATSLGVYLGLSLGVIGSSLSLSWALYVLICQRTPEFSPQDDVTRVSEGRQRAALAVILVSLLILLPGAGVGAGGADSLPML